MFEKHLAKQLTGDLMRQQSATNELPDVACGAETLAQARASTL
jgi:hypothetical protein